MPKQIRIFTFFTAAYFLSYFYRSANAVIAPDLSRELSLGAEQLGLMTSLFFATFALVQIPLGIGLDKWGPRWVTPGLMAVGVLGSLIFGLAASFGILAIGRALIGIGMAGILMGSLKVFSQWFSPQRFATVSGLLVGIGSSGALIAATPLAWLNNTWGWRTVFVNGAVIVALVALSIVVWTRNTPPGVAWTGGQVSGVSLDKIFKDRRFWHIAPLNFFMAGTLLAVQGLWAGPFLFDVLRLSDLQVGNLLLLMGIGSTLGFSMSGWLADRLGLSRVVIVSGLIFVLTQFILILRPPSVSAISVVYVLFGFAGAFNIMLLAHARQIFPNHMTGQVVSAVNLFGIGGTFLLQWWLGLIIGFYPVESGGHYPPQAYTAAFLFTTIGTLLTLVWYFPVTRLSSESIET
jgi:predicted MFS family arabinose efflux permease